MFCHLLQTLHINTALFVPPKAGLYLNGKQKKRCFSKVYTCLLKKLARLSRIVVYKDDLHLLSAAREAAGRTTVTRFVLYLPVPDVFPCAGSSGRFSAPDSCSNSASGCAWSGLVCVSQALSPWGGALEGCCAPGADFCSQQSKGTFPNALQDLTSTGSRDFLGKGAEPAWKRHGRKWVISDFVCNSQVEEV